MARSFSLAACVALFCALASWPAVAQVASDSLATARLGGTSVFQPGYKYLSSSGRHYLRMLENKDLVLMQVRDASTGGVDAVRWTASGINGDMRKLVSPRIGPGGDLVYRGWIVNGRTDLNIATRIFGTERYTERTSPAADITPEGQYIVLERSTRVWPAPGETSIGALLTAPCTPEPDWPHCAPIVFGEHKQAGIVGPRLTVRGTARVTPEAMSAVVQVVRTMILSMKLTPEALAAKDWNANARLFDGYTAYVTNGEDWDTLKDIKPVGNLWPDLLGNELRGGAQRYRMWVTEQMMCRRGVATRNADFAAGRRASRDDNLRVLDQVVHEFAHSIDFALGLRPTINEVYKDASTTGFPAAEAFAAGVQSWFGNLPGETPEARAARIPGEAALMDSVFYSTPTNRIRLDYANYLAGPPPAPPAAPRRLLPGQPLLPAAPTLSAPDPCNRT